MIKKSLALLLTVFMVLSMVPVSVFATGVEDDVTVVTSTETNEVATDTTAVTTAAAFKTAYDAAQAGDTITLGADIADLDATIAKDVTLDLGGNTLTDAYIIVTAKVTIKNGSIKNTNESYPLVVQNGGTLTVEDVAIEASKSDRAIWVRSNNSSLIFNSGSILATKGENNTKTNLIAAIYTDTNTNVTINGGTIMVDTPDNKAVGIYGNYSNANVTVNGGKISTSGKNYSYGINVDGDITVTGGEIVTNEKGYGYSSGIRYGNNYALVTATGDVSISGGTITTNGYSGYIVSVGRTYSSNDQTVSITGGTMKNDLSEVEMTTGGHTAPVMIWEGSASPVTATVENGNFEGFNADLLRSNNENTSLEISGGSFDVAPKAEYVETGATITVAGQTMTKTEEGSLEEVKPAEVATYDELVAALANGGEIKLTADITLDTKITVLDGTTIDLNGKTLYINVENSYYNNATIKNGNIVLGKDDVHVCDGYFLVNAGKTLVLNGVNMTSAEGGIKGYAVFHLNIGANLDLINSTLNIQDNEYSAGYIVYAGEATATLDVMGSTITGSKVNGVVHATTVIDDSTFTITDAVEHGINRSGLTINDSDVTISGGTGRGITAQHGDLVITGDSTVTITDMGEATIELRNDNDMTVAETATVKVDVAVNNTTNGTVTGNVTVDTTIGAAVIIGETGYATLAEALAAAKTMTGDVTVEIYDKVTLNESLSGSYTSITFVGKDTDAEIYLDVQGYITATGKKVTFEDLILSKSEGGYITNAGFMNVAFGVYDVISVTYNNCTFANGAYASIGEVTFTGCTFKRSYDKYGLWAYGNVDVTVDNCTFDDYRGIKMYAEGAAKTVDLTVKDTDFSAVTDKPAIVLTYGESVALEGNTYSDTGVFELDLDGAPNGTPIESTDAITCVNDNGACGVLVDGKIYTTVAQAAEVATEGSTVTLLHNSTETVELAEGVTLDKNGFAAENVTVAVPVYVAEVGGVKYATVLEALAAAIENGASQLILLGDSREAMPTDVEIKLKADLEIVSGTGNPVSAKFYNNGTSYDFIINSDTSVGNFTFTIGENVTFQLEDRVIWAGYYGNNVDVVVDGTLAGYQIWHGADTTVNATGTMKTTGEALVMRRGATLSVDGGKVETNYFNILAGNIFAENSAEITCGALWVANTGSYAGEGSVSINIWDSTLTSSGNLKVATNNGVAYVDVYNSTVNFTDFDGYGASVLDAKTILTVNGEDASLSLKTLENNGTIEVYDGGAMDVATFTNNNVVSVEDGSTFSAANAGANVAKVGNNYYGSLQAAINATADGETVTLLTNITLTETLTISADKNVVLELNGKTVSMEKTETVTANHEMIKNNGTLTIQDTVGGGKLSYKYTGANLGTSYAANTITTEPGSVLTVKSGTIENLTYDSATIAYAIDGRTNGGIGDVTINIEGGTITSLRQAVRIFANSTTKTATLNISGGEITGRVIVQNANANANKAAMSITGGTFKANTYKTDVLYAGGSNGATIDMVPVVSGGVFQGEISSTLPNGFIIGGTFSTDVSDLCADGYVVEQNGDGTYGIEVDPTYGKVAKIGDDYYETLAEAVEEAQAGDEIIILADVAEDVTVPADVVFNGNGKQVGIITADGEITFKGHTKATNFGVTYTNTTINIGEGACLELTGTGRMVIGHGCTFNITGSIADAKTANVADLTPSLVMAGASFTGAGVTFNVTNAYIKATYYCSSSKSASDTFDFNITNSIWEQVDKLAFESQSTAATVNFKLKDSVLTTTSHLVFGVSRGEIVIDNSNVNVGASRQIENQSTMIVKNGSVVNGAVATSSNAKNPGTITVDNATYAVSGEFSGSDLGTGTIIVKNDASFTAGSITKANIVIDAADMTAGEVNAITADLSKFAGTLEVINNTLLNAEIVDGKIVLIERTLTGSGNETDPFLINNVDDLILFRDMVNAGNSYDNQYFKLSESINLSAAATVMLLSTAVTPNWEPIGTEENPFKGTFDGNGETISNMIVVGEKNQGFFGYADNATIKNINIENATVIGTDCVGAIAGQVYSVSLIDNCHVSGSIKIEGQTNVGGIVGKYYTKVTNCSVIGDGASTSYVKGVYVASDLEGDNIGGIMGHCGENNSLTGNTVKNITVSGTRKVGGIVGIADQNTDVQNCVVENVVIETTATADYANSKVTSMSIGGLIGQYQAAGSNNDGTVIGCTVKNVTFNNASGVTVDVGPIVGGARGGSTGMLAPSANVTASGNKIYMSTITGSTNEYLMVAVAKIGDVNYYLFEEALAAANATAGNDTITLLADVTASFTALENMTLVTEVQGGVKVTNTETGYVDFNNVMLGSNVTLNMNNVLTSGEVENIIEGTLNVAEVYYNRYNSKTTIQNGGKVTTGGMTIVRYNTVAEAGIYIYGDGNDETVEFICNGDALGVYSGTFYAEDAVIEAKKLWVDHENEANSYIAINAEFVNSKLDLTQQLRLYNDANLTLTATTVNVAEVQVRVNATPTVVADSTSVINATSVINLDGATLNAVLGKDGTVTFVNMVAKVGTKTYATLAEALAAVEKDDTITLLSDTTTSEVIVIDKSITFNGNGKTITYTGSNRIVNIIVADLDITLKDLNLVSSASYCERGINIGADIDITLDNVSVKGTNVTYAVNLPVTSGGSEVTIKDSDLTGCMALNVWGENVVINVTDSELVSVDVATHENYAAVVLNNNGTYSAENTVITITGGKITALDENGDSAVAIRNATATGAVNVSDTTEVTGNISEVIAVIIYDGYDEFYSYFTLQDAINKATNDPTATIKLLKDITVTEVTVGGRVVLDLNAKTLTGKIILNAADAVLTTTAEDLDVTTNVVNHKVVYADGAYKVVEKVYVAQVGETKFESLQDAENAADDGDIIVLLTDIVLDGMVTFFNAAGERMVTLNMNGKTITLNDNWSNDVAKSAFWVCDGLTITGNGTINAAPAGDPWAYAVIVGHRTVGTTEGYSGELVIENGTFYSDEASVISVTHGSATIKGGTFEAAGNMDLNCIDDMRAAGKASITVKGGTFVGFNPENNASEGAGTNFCADGYAALLNLDDEYVVGAKPTATVNDLGAMIVPAGDYMVYGNGSNTVDMPLSFVMQFLADQDAEDMETSPFAEWFGDFVLTFTGIENGSFSADGCYLAGYYGDFGWVKVPVDGLTIENGVRYPVMLGVGMGQKYDYICESVKDFRCALYLTPEILEANPNLKVSLELSVVDNSKGDSAAADALADTTLKYVNVVGDTEYTAEDFKVASGEVAYRAYINDSASREAIQIDLANLFARESVVIKLYDAEGNLLTTTTLKAGGVEAANYTANIVLWGSASSSWDTVIHAEKLTVANMPATIKLYADDVLVDTYENALGAGTGVDETAKYFALDCVYKEAKIDDTYYATLADAIAAANANDTITVVADIELSETVTVAAGKAVILELNGKTISSTHASDYAMMHVQNGATLTIKDSSDAKTGKITCAAGGNNIGAAIWVEGALLLESGTIELTGSWILGFAVDVRPNAWGTAHTAPASFIMNGGSIISSDTAVRIASNSSDTYTEMGVFFTMNNGSIESAWDAIFVQHLYVGDLDVTVLNGTVIGANSVLRVYGDAGSDIDMIVKNGKFEGVIKVADAYANAKPLTISGGIFSSPVAEEYCAEGYIPADNGDGTYGVKVGSYIAQIGEKKFESLQEAINAAQNGETIKILADIDAPTEVINILKKITLDLNGHMVDVLALAIFGQGGNIVDNGETKGLLKVEKGNIIMTACEYPMLPVWNEEGTGYVFVAVNPYLSLKTETDDKDVVPEDGFVVKIRPNITGGGISTADTFKDGALDNQLTFRIVIRCMRDGKMVEEIAPVLTDELIQKVYTNGTMIKLTVGGATDIFDEYVIAVEIASEVGVKYTYVHDTPYVPAVTE